MSEHPAILFLCVHNAGRSQMAAAFARVIGGEGVVVYGAGSSPSETLNPVVVDVMGECGIDISGESPRALTDEVGRSADVVVTMGCGDACPVYPGIRYQDWDVDDPAGRSTAAVRTIRDDVERRVRDLLDELGVAVA